MAASSTRTLLYEGQRVSGGPLPQAPYDSTYNTTGVTYPEGVFFHNECELTLDTAGLTSDTAQELLPANSIIFPIQARITETINNVTNWALGVSGTAAKFLAADTDLTAGTTKVGAAHWAGTVAIWNATATKVRVTCTGAQNSTGKVKILVTGIKFPALSA